GGFTTSVSMSSPFPFIAVPQDDRHEVHDQDHREEDEDRGAQGRTPFVAGQARPAVDDRGESRVPTLQGLQQVPRSPGREVAGHRTYQEDRSGLTERACESEDRT